MAWCLPLGLLFALLPIVTGPWPRAEGRAAPESGPAGSWTEVAQPLSYSGEYSGGDLLLPTGKILSLRHHGGTGNSAEASAQLYDPATDSWTRASYPPCWPAPPSRPCNTYRVTNPVVLKGSSDVCGVHCGKVLMRIEPPFGIQTPPRWVIYDPATQSQVDTLPTPYTPEVATTAALLWSDDCEGTGPPPWCGKVLAAGGADVSFPLEGDPNEPKHAQVFDPKSNAWVATTGLREPRQNGISTGLRDGRVLVVGGSGQRSAETYDPESETWTLTHPPAGIHHTDRKRAALLDDDRVFVAGGDSDLAEIFDPATNAFTTVPGCDCRMVWVTLLPSGKVLVIHQPDWPESNSGYPARLYDPGRVSAPWVAAGNAPFSGGGTLIAGSQAACGRNCGKVLVTPTVGHLLQGDPPPPPAQVYTAPPEVTSITPNQGSAGGGDTVEITGSGLADVRQVAFGAVPISCETFSDVCRPDPERSDAKLLVRTPAHPPGTVNVRVTTPGGVSAATDADRFTFTAPEVASLSPRFGPATGGTWLSIVGTGFAGASKVSIGSVELARSAFTVSADGTVITVTVPPGDPGPVEVVVTAGAASSVPTQGSTFTYHPVLTALQPPSGEVKGGTSVRLTGKGLAAVDQVHFGQRPATSFTKATGTEDTEITAVSPPHGPGTVPVTVTTASGLVSVAPVGGAIPTFTYEPPWRTRSDDNANNPGGPGDRGTSQGEPPPTGGSPNASPTPSASPGSLPQPATATQPGNAPQPGTAPQAGAVLQPGAAPQAGVTPQAAAVPAPVGSPGQLATAPVPWAGAPGQPGAAAAGGQAEDPEEAPRYAMVRHEGLLTALGWGAAGLTMMTGCALALVLGCRSRSQPSLSGRQDRPQAKGAY